MEDPNPDTSPLVREAKNRGDQKQWTDWTEGKAGINVLQSSLDLFILFPYQYIQP